MKPKRNDSLGVFKDFWAKAEDKWNLVNKKFEGSLPHHLVISDIKKNHYVY